MRRRHALLCAAAISCITNCGSVVSELDRINRLASEKSPTVTPPDVTPPTLLSTLPANLATNVGPCTGSPCRGKVILVFNESMNTSLTQTLTTEIWNGSAYVTTPNTNTTFVWSASTSSNDTLTINISWYWFPENSQIRFTLAASGFADAAGNALTAQIQRSFTTTTAKQSFAVADTGLATCYNAASGIGCGSDPLFLSQDGDFLNAPVARSITGPNLSGASDYTTTNFVTNLVWRSCNEGRSGATCAVGSDSAVDWHAALNQCSALNLTTYGGRTGWRLPAFRELETLPRLAGSNPAIDGGQYPATAWGIPAYWSLSAAAGAAANAWSVGFSTGSSGLTAKTTGTNVVRCVSTGTVTSASYTDNGDGTVSDNVANLRWQKCSRGQTQDAACSAPAATTTNWSGALQYCDTLTLGAFANASNWRLPNGNELRSLMDDSVTAPAMNTTLFPNSNNSWYWTSSTSMLGGTNAQQIHSGNGTWSSPSKSGAVSVRCVATGP